MHSNSSITTTTTTNSTSSSGLYDEYAEYMEELGSSVFIIPRISSILSVIASSLIIYIIFRSSTRLNSIYHRIMFGMSVGDILSSAAFAVGQVALPRPGIYESLDMIYRSPHLQSVRKGNKATCGAQGFFTVYGIFSAYLYNAALCWYYYFVIVRGIEDCRIVSSKLEPLFHAVSVGWPLLISITLLFLDGYSPGTVICTASK